MIALFHFAASLISIASFVALVPRRRCCGWCLCWQGQAFQQTATRSALCSYFVLVALASACDGADAALAPSMGLAHDLLVRLRAVAWALAGCCTGVAAASLLVRDKLSGTMQVIYVTATSTALVLAMYLLFGLDAPACAATARWFPALMSTGLALVLCGRQCCSVTTHPRWPQVQAKPPRHRTAGILSFALPSAELVPRLSGRKPQCGHVFGVLAGVTALLHAALASILDSNGDGTTTAASALPTAATLVASSAVAAPITTAVHVVLLLAAGRSICKTVEELRPWPVVARAYSITSRMDNRTAVWLRRMAVCSAVVTLVAFAVMAAILASRLGELAPWWPAFGSGVRSGLLALFAALAVLDGVLALGVGLVLSPLRTTVPGVVELLPSELRRLEAKSGLPQGFDVMLREARAFVSREEEGKRAMETAVAAAEFLRDAGKDNELDLGPEGGGSGGGGAGAFDAGGGGGRGRERGNSMGTIEIRPPDQVPDRIARVVQDRLMTDRDHEEHEEAEAQRLLLENDESAHGGGAARRRRRRSSSSSGGVAHPLTVAARVVHDESFSGARKADLGCGENLARTRCGIRMLYVTALLSFFMSVVFVLIVGLVAGAYNVLRVLGVACTSTQTSASVFVAVAHAAISTTLASAGFGAGSTLQDTGSVCLQLNQTLAASPVSSEQAGILVLAAVGATAQLFPPALALASLQATAWLQADRKRRRRQITQVSNDAARQRVQVLGLSEDGELLVSNRRRAPSAAENVF